MKVREKGEMCIQGSVPVRVLDGLGELGESLESSKSYGSDGMEA
jgi:hypothetical protein